MEGDSAEIEEEEEEGRAREEEAEGEQRGIVEGQQDLWMGKSNMQKEPTTQTPTQKSGG